MRNPDIRSSSEDCARIYRPARFFAVAVAVMFFLYWPHSALAQSRHASIRGFVRDAKGAAVATAVVTATHRETGTHITATSGEAGDFEIPRLGAGSYEVTVSRPGFLSAKQTLELTEGEIATLDWILEGGLETPASADPAEPSGKSDPASETGQITESQLAGLPLNGRSYTQLATLQTEVSDPFAGSAARGGGSGGLTVSGGRSTSNTFLLDGTNVMDSENKVPQSAAGVQLGSDAVSQVQVYATNYSPHYGRGSGGVLNSISHSGTAQVHGTFFEYFRNSTLDARNFFDPGKNPPPFKRNQFGSTLTGPLVKDRTFWMGSFESLRDRLSETIVDIYPDALARQGIITDADGRVTQTIEVHPAVVPYLALYPLPNKRSLGRGLGEHATGQFLPTNETFFMGRLDHKLSENVSLFGRYSFDDAVSDSNQASSTFFKNRTQSRQQYLTLATTHVFHPSLIGSFRFGYTRPVAAITNVATINVPPSLFFVPSWPEIGLLSVSNLSAFGNSSNFPEAKTMNTFQWTGDIAAQKGLHALKFGVEVQRYRWDVWSTQGRGGNWFFNSLESLLRGGPSGTSMSLSLPGADDTKAYRETLMGLYVQDAFKLSRRLLFNLGLRYEFTTLLHDRSGRTSSLPDVLHDKAMQVGPLLANNPSLRDFSPRLGFSWSPFASLRTVVSGGFGIYYDQLMEYQVDSQKSTAPFFPLVVNQNFDASNSFPRIIEAAAGVPLQARTLDYHNFSTPMVLRYHFAIQQHVRGGWNLRSSYVGARGNHLLRSYEVNLLPVPIVRSDGSLCFPPDVNKDPIVNLACPPLSSDQTGPRNPAFGGISLIASDAQSFYNSLQLSASLGPVRGSSVQVGYTFSKSIDDATANEIRNIGTNSQQYGFMRTLDRGLSDYDIRHRFSVNYFYAPIVKGGPGWLTSVMRGWRFGGIFNLRTGTPFSPTVNIRSRGYLFSPIRPNLVPGRSNNPKLGTVEHYFDPTAFSLPPLGTLGNLGRNTVISPSVVNADLSIQRDFAVDSKRQLQFRVDIFNLANHPNFNRNTGATLVVYAGTSTTPGAAAGKLTDTVTTARQIQFALRFSF